MLALLLLNVHENEYGMVLRAKEAVLAWRDSKVRLRHKARSSDRDFAEVRSSIACCDSYFRFQPSNEKPQCSRCASFLIKVMREKSGGDQPNAVIFYWLLWKKVELAKLEETTPPQERRNPDENICTICHLYSKLEWTENRHPHTIELMFLVLGYLKGLEFSTI